MNGKDTCRMLKHLREQIASDYGIPGFEFKECDFEGDCQGHCPVCDAEAEKLFNLIKGKEPINEKHDFDIDEVGTPDIVLMGEVVAPDDECLSEEQDKSDSWRFREPLGGKILPPEESFKDTYKDKNHNKKGLFVKKDKDNE